VADDDVEFLDITPGSDGGEDLLVFGPRRSVPSRGRQTAGVVMGLLGLVVGALWAGFGTRADTPLASAVHVPAFTTTLKPGSPPIPVTVLPTYVRQMRSLDNGDLLVAGTPAALPPALATAFGSVTGVRVQTVIAPALGGSSTPFVCRLTSARSAAFRIQVLAVRRASGDCALALHPPPAPDSSYSFTELTRAGYDIQVAVHGPNPMSLMLLNADTAVLDGLISAT
jgi:hypothetical protein